MKRKTHNRLSDGDRAEIAEAYLNGETQTSIAARRGVDRGTVRNSLNKLNVAVRSQGESCRKHALRQDVFDIITEESAYWVGMLMADGSVRSRKGLPWAINLTLSWKDKAHVEAFRNFLGSTHKIGDYVAPDPSGQLTRKAKLSVSSTRLALKLSEYGVVNPKPSRESLLLDGNRHFWRGFFDGDGCVRWNKEGYPEIRIGCGARRLMNQFYAFFQSVFPGLRSNINRDRNIWVVHSCGLPAAHLVASLYSDATYSLSRKMAIAQEIITAYRLVDTA